MKLNFTEKEYNSDYGFITYIWGPMLWHFLHIIFNYPLTLKNIKKMDKKDTFKIAIIFL